MDPRIRIRTKMSWIRPHCAIQTLTWGGGEPPVLEQVRLSGRPSVAAGEAGSTRGGEGFSSTVRLIFLVWRRVPLPEDFTMQRKLPLSLS